MGKQVAASMTKLYWSAAEHYGIPRDELLAAAGLQASQLSDPNGLVSADAANQLLRALVRRANDPALGLVMARNFDLRAMGFWGYALLSSLTFGQRMQLHLRYYRLHYPDSQVSYRVVGDRFLADFSASGIPPDLAPVTLDCGLAVSATQFAKHTGRTPPDMELWLTYPEAPHHAALRALVSGPVRFNAPHFRISIPAAALKLRLAAGDPHLFELARAQVDAQLSKVLAMLKGDVLSQVRERVSARLASDASLESIAADLRISGRTLRRKLSAAGASFQALLDEARRARAIRDLTETDAAIVTVAEGVGYRDPANFRRAFRRWTGAAPTTYRAQHRR